MISLDEAPAWVGYAFLILFAVGIYLFALLISAFVWFYEKVNHDSHNVRG